MVFGASVPGAVAAVATASGGHHPSLLLCFCRRAIWSPSTFFCYQTIGWFSSGLGSIFMGDFELVAMAVFVLLSLS